MLFQYSSVVKKNKQNQRRSKKKTTWKRWVAQLSIACAYLGGPLKTGKRRTSQLRPNSWPRAQEMDFLGMWFEVKYCKIESKAKMKQHKKTRKLRNTLKRNAGTERSIWGGKRGGMKSLVAGFGRCQCNAKWGIVAQQLFGFFEFLSPDPALCEPRLAVRLHGVYILYTYIIFILLVDSIYIFRTDAIEIKIKHTRAYMATISYKNLYKNIIGVCFDKKTSGCSHILEGDKNKKAGMTYARCARAHLGGHIRFPCIREAPRGVTQNGTVFVARRAGFPQPQEANAFGSMFVVNV